jgi:hypothetical protein
MLLEDFRHGLEACDKIFVQAVLAREKWQPLLNAQSRPQ